MRKPQLSFFLAGFFISFFLLVLERLEFGA